MKYRYNPNLNDVTEYHPNANEYLDLEDLWSKFSGTRIERTRLES